MQLAHDNVFYRDLGVLLRPQRRLEFWPAPEQCLEERINATVRFLLYAGVLLYVATRKPKYVVLSWAAILLLGAAHYHQQFNADAGSVTPLLDPPARSRTPADPFANQAEAFTDTAAPPWDAANAKEARHLFRSKMFMNLSEASSAQSSERQFLQVPDQDMDAFLHFLAQKHEPRP